MSNAEPETQAQAALDEKNALRRTWSTAEDERLRQIVAKYGARQWALIATHMGSRKDWQCRERWQNHLCPRVKKGAWTAEEDDVIMRAANMMGQKWSRIKTLLPGRTGHAIKNRFHSIQRRMDGDGDPQGPDCGDEDGAGERDGVCAGTDSDGGGGSDHLGGGSDNSVNGMSSQRNGAAAVPLHPYAAAPVAFGGIPASAAGAGGQDLQDMLRERGLGMSSFSADALHLAQAVGSRSDYAPLPTHFGQSAPSHGGMPQHTHSQSFGASAVGTRPSFNGSALNSGALSVSAGAPSSAAPTYLPSDMLWLGACLREGELAVSAAHGGGCGANLSMPFAAPSGFVGAPQPQAPAPLLPPMHPQSVQPPRLSAAAATPTLAHLPLQSQAALRTLPKDNSLDSSAVSADVDAILGAPGVLAPVADAEGSPVTHRHQLICHLAAQLLVFAELPVENRLREKVIDGVMAALRSTVLLPKDAAVEGGQVAGMNMLGEQYAERCGQ